MLREHGQLAVHVYSANRWPRREAPDPLDVSALDEIERPRAPPDSSREKLHLWRAVRFYPYLIPL